MSKIAVLAEKPSVGKELARVLNCRQNKKSYFEGEKYLVTWAFGHLVTLANPEDYDDKYVHWDLASLPIIPEKMKLIVIKKTGRHFAEVRKILKRSDISEIIIATDAGSITITRNTTEALVWSMLASSFSTFSFLKAQSSLPSLTKALITAMPEKLSWEKSDSLE